MVQNLMFIWNYLVGQRKTYNATVQRQQSPILELIKNRIYTV